MRTMFFGAGGRLRTGWWMLLFLGLFLASRVAYGPVTRGLQALGATQGMLEVAPFGFVLLVTWICVRLRRQSLASVGFRLAPRWWKEAGFGVVLGLSSALLACGMMFAVGGVRLELDPARSLAALGYGLYLFACVALFEETLFRGFLFQRLIEGTGTRFAQIVLALLFAASHWGNPDMQPATLLLATLEIFVAALLLGLAYLRTRSLALPVGIHLGWNWAQGHLLGFDVSGFDHAGWFRPVLLDERAWLSGGPFGLEASVFALLADLLLLLLLWRWRGTTAAANADRMEPVPAV